MLALNLNLYGIVCTAQYIFAVIQALSSFSVGSKNLIDFQLFDPEANFAIVKVVLSHVCIDAWVGRLRIILSQRRVVLRMFIAFRVDGNGAWKTEKTIVLVEHLVLAGHDLELLNLVRLVAQFEYEGVTLILLEFTVRFPWDLGVATEAIARVGHD